METLHPDLYIQEIGGRPVLSGVGVGTAGLEGTTQKGPNDELGLVTDYGMFQTRFGSDGGDIDENVKSFFNNGGTRMYIARVCGTGKLKSFAALKNMKVEARWYGAYANTLRANTIKYEVAIATGDSIITASNEVDLVDASEVSLGDKIYFWDGGVWVGFTVATISGNKIYFQAQTVTGTINAASTPGLCPTVHKVSIKAVGNLANAATSLELESIGDLRVGDYVMAFDYNAGVPREVGIPITGISGKIISFAAVTTPGSVTLTTPYVVSLEFDLTLTQGGEVIEVLQKLSAASTSPRFYKTIVNDTTGSSNMSDEVELTYTGGGSSAGSDIPYSIVSPYSGDDIQLASGADGSTPTSSEIIGSAVNPRSGLGLFEEVKDVQMIGIPGIITESVIKAGITYCELTKKTATFFLHPDEGKTPLQVKQWLQQTLNVDNSHAVCYWPWYNVDNGDGGEKLIPPIGGVMGAWAKIASDTGVSSPQANIALYDATSLEYNVTDGEQDILNPIGINCIREFAGRGIRIWGCRTLTSLLDGRQYTNVRALLNYVEQTIYEGTQWAIFQKSDPRLFTKIKMSVEAFLTTLWSEGQLYPSNDKKKAFYVKCDDELNKPETLAEGKVYVEVGINPPYPAEFVIFKIGVWDGSGSVTETV